MKLLVPYVDELKPVDKQLLRLAEFLGIKSETFPLPLVKSTGRWTEYLERQIPEQEACFVINPCVLQDWVGGDELPSELATLLVTRFRHLLVHSPGFEHFDRSVLNALSCGNLNAVQKIDHADSPYEISADSKDICESFAGLSFGPVNLANDRVFTTVREGAAVRVLISIEGKPLMAAIERGNRKIWFLAGENVADLQAEVGEAPVSEFFSQLLPYAMALRAIFSDASWRPNRHHASVVIDDPLLQCDYGFLNFESLLSLMARSNFHSTIAFIPHNFRRSSPRITRMFRENADRFSICFHGNDHTGAEFASADAALLNTLLQIAEQRMELHTKSTGVSCDRVMVFPQGQFSVEAMTVLKSRNFDGAVNTTSHPKQSPVRLTLGEIAQPAVLRYGNFPLFLRKDSVQTESADIAFNCFFGKPVLIVEHHDIFQNPEPLAKAATRINKVVPNIHWSNLSSLVRNSILRKSTHDGVQRIRAYSGTVQVSNDSKTTKRFQIEWKYPVQQEVVCEQVLQDGVQFKDFAVNATGVQVSVDLPPGSTRTYSLVHRNPYPDLGNLGFRKNARAFVRRRLSEVRDNYLSKSPHVLKAAKTLKRYIPI
jgi:hypothetical protein